MMGQRGVAATQPDLGANQEEHEPEDPRPNLLAYVDHRERSVLLGGVGAGDVVDAAGIWHTSTARGLRLVALRHLAAVVTVAQRMGGTVRVVHVDGSPCGGVECATSGAGQAQSGSG